MTHLVPLAEHPSNRDPTARIVAEVRRHDGWDLLWRVRAGVMASLAGPHGHALPGHFETEREALDAIAAFRATGAI